jgi:hypothetical protein
MKRLSAQIKDKLQERLGFSVRPASSSFRCVLSKPDFSRPEHRAVMDWAGELACLASQFGAPPRKSIYAESSHRLSISGVASIKLYLGPFLYAWSSGRADADAGREAPALLPRHSIRAQIKRAFAQRVCASPAAAVSLVRRHRTSFTLFTKQWPLSFSLAPPPRHRHRTHPWTYLLAERGVC